MEFTEGSSALDQEFVSWRRDVENGAGLKTGHSCPEEPGKGTITDHSLICSKNEDPWNQAGSPPDVRQWAFPACATVPRVVMRAAINPLSLFPDFILGKKEAGSSEVTL